MYKVVRLPPVRQSTNNARAAQSASEHGLQQRMRTNLDDDSVVWNVLKCFVEQHRTDEVVDVVVGG